MLNYRLKDKELTKEQQLRLVFLKLLKEMLNKTFDMLCMDYDDLALVYAEEMLREVKIRFK